MSTLQREEKHCGQHDHLVWQNAIPWLHEKAWWSFEDHPHANLHNYGYITKNIRNHLVQGCILKKSEEIRVNTKIQGAIKIKYNKPDIFIVT